ncbi:neprilysin-1-like [Ornithodoros turicata]|uniref:neprilysin-1-like n=1 Tax=Ornithodoros turicata TaxID=34597 RepID=UPI003139B284
MRRRTLMLSIITASIVCSTGFLGSVIIRKFSEMRQEGLALRQSTAWAHASSEMPKPLNLFDKARQKIKQGTAMAASTFHPTASILKKNGSVCSHPVCRKQATYLRGKIDETQEPCEDFYSYVCSAKWSGKDRTADTATYQDQTTGKLLYDLQKMFHRYFEHHNTTYYNFPSAFVSQALFFVPNCTSIYSRNGVGWDPWQELLTRLGLDGWPFSFSLEKRNVSQIAGLVDGTLGVFPFVELLLANEYDGHYVIQLDTPQTVLRRHQLWYTHENLFNYTQLVARAFSTLRVIKNVEILAENIAILELRLEDAISLKKFVPIQNRPKVISQIPHSAKWSWSRYLNAIFGYSVSMGVHAEVLAQEYFSDLAVIMDNTSYTTLANYIGFRTMVHLSAVLPDEVEFLVPLSHDHPIVGVGERFQACTRLLERMYPYGVRVFLRMTLGDPDPLRYSPILDTDMTSMFNITQQLVANLVSNAFWFNPVERLIARQKIMNVAFDFMGTVKDLSLPALYYGTKVPPFNGKKVLQSFFVIQSNTKRIYYDPWHRTMDFDNQYHISSLRPDFEYIYGKNALYIPYAVVAFLREVAGTMEPIFAPIVAQFVLRGLYKAVDESGSSVDHHTRTREWWSTETTRKYSYIKDCFFKQYKSEMAVKSPDIDIITDMDSNIVDNGIMVPLYDYYLTLLGMDSETARRTRAPFGTFTVEQLFFIYFAISRCDQRGAEFAKRQLGFGLTPANIKVNLPLKNFPKFAEAFGCQRGNEMCPQDRCLIW